MRIKSALRKGYVGGADVHRSGGFTLLEMIVSVGIMMIVAATAAATLNATFSIKRAAENAVESTRDTQIVGTIFINDVTNAHPPNPLLTAETGVASGSTTTTELPYFLAGPFYGEARIVTFYTTGNDPRSEVPGDLRYVEFEAVADRNGVMSLVRRTKVNLLEDIVTDPVEEVLVRNVVSVEFEYFDGTSWQVTWDSTAMGNILPYAVQMRLTLQPLREGLPERVIKRTASIPCAAPTTQTADTAVIE